LVDAFKQGKDKAQVAEVWIFGEPILSKFFFCNNHKIMNLRRFIQNFTKQENIWKPKIGESC
jgi:hypothetical protein